MIVSLIWAMGRNRVIGRGNALPWRLPADMRWFRRQTLGKPIIMGRKTFESFGARPLPGRTNIVVSRDPGYRAAGAVVVVSETQALAAAADAAEVMVIGGASFYAQMLPRADRLYLTLIDADFDGDVWFPEFDWAQWREVSREDHRADARNAYACSFIVLERRAGQAAGAA